MSVLEIISMLKRTRIPTIVVEGKDDIVVWNEVENILCDKRVSIVQTWGRNNLIKVFDGMSEFNADVPILYIADQDDWSFLGVPRKYEKIIFTNGYSIENDMICDANLLKMARSDDINYQKELEYIIEYYSLFLVGKICRFEEGKFKISDHINKITSSGILELSKIKFMHFYEFSAPIISLVKNDYMNLVRGKSLMELICKYSMTGVNPSNLLKMAAIQHGPKMHRICDEVRSLMS